MTIETRTMQLRKYMNRLAVESARANQTVDEGRKRNLRRFRRTPHHLLYTGCAPSPKTWRRRFVTYSGCRAAAGSRCSAVFVKLMLRAKRAGETLLREIDLRLRYGSLGRYIAQAERITGGWTKGDEAIALASICRKLPTGAIVVEIGSFLGGSAVLLAGARMLCGDGRVHCVDPFDASGDAFSIPFYLKIVAEQPETLRERFDENIRRAGLTDWVRVHAGTAESIAVTWREPIDMLFLDGDQSPAGARSSYEHWAPFLKLGGILALHNSSDRRYDEGHDGYRRVAVEKVKPPLYEDVVCIGTTTFARKTRPSTDGYARY